MSINIILCPHHLALVVLFFFLLFSSSYTLGLLNKIKNCNYLPAITIIIYELTRTICGWRVFACIYSNLVALLLSLLVVLILETYQKKTRLWLGTEPWIAWSKSSFIIVPAIIFAWLLQAFAKCNAQDHPLIVWLIDSFLIRIVRGSKFLGTLQNWEQSINFCRMFAKNPAKITPTGF